MLCNSTNNLIIKDMKLWNMLGIILSLMVDLANLSSICDIVEISSEIQNSQFLGIFLRRNKTFPLNLHLISLMLKLLRYLCDLICDCSFFWDSTIAYACVFDSLIGQCWTKHSWRLIMHSSVMQPSMATNLGLENLPRAFCSALLAV